MTQPTISAERIEEMLADAKAGASLRGEEAREVLTLAQIALRAAQPSEAVAWRPTYEQIIALVEDCRVRRDKAGESSRMMSKWISEGLNALYASPPVQAQLQVKAVVNAAEPLRRSMESENPNKFLRDDIEVMLDAVAALATPPAPVDGGVTGALSGIIAAWEATKPGDTTRTEIQRWLIEDMKPAIDYARAALTASRAAVAQDETP